MNKRIIRKLSIDSRHWDKKFSFFIFHYANCNDSTIFPPRGSHNASYRNSLKHHFLLRLYRDESGVVLAFTVIVFLALFVMVGAVYAVGETVRQRIELQNAADAAAYSAAVVQADAISRIAALNRAMAWTYVQMVKHEMDFTVDRWLEETLLRWGKDLDKARKFAAKSTCFKFDFYAGEFLPHRVHVKINRRKWYWASSLAMARLNALAAGKNYLQLMPVILRDRRNIRAMNRAETHIIANLPRRIRETVKQSLNDNLADTWNDRFVDGGADFRFAVETGNWQALANPGYLERSSTFRVQRNEGEFLKYADKPKDPFRVFDRGIDTRRHDGWFVLKRGVQGIQRHYHQKNNYLLAEWKWGATQWHWTPTPHPICIPMYRKRPIGNRVTGAEAIKGLFLFTRTELAVPWVLKKTFFGRDGAIVVGVARRLNNPMQFMIGDRERPGLYGAYSAGSDRTMWTASAARAGYAIGSGRTRAAGLPGNYLSTWEPPDNLKWSDWDAILLPLHRAWSNGRGHTWSGLSGTRILDHLWRSSRWQALTGGSGVSLDRIGSNHPPPGLRGRMRYSDHDIERMLTH